MPYTFPPSFVRRSGRLAERGSALLLVLVFLVVVLLSAAVGASQTQVALLDVANANRRLTAEQVAFASNMVAYGSLQEYLSRRVEEFQDKINRGSFAVASTGKTGTLEPSPLPDGDVADLLLSAKTPDCSDPRLPHGQIVLTRTGLGFKIEDDPALSSLGPDAKAALQQVQAAYSNVGFTIAGDVLCDYVFAGDSDVSAPGDSENRARYATLEAGFTFVGTWDVAGTSSGRRGAPGTPVVATESATSKASPTPGGLTVKGSPEPDPGCPAELPVRVDTRYEQGKYVPVCAPAAQSTSTLPHVSGYQPAREEIPAEQVLGSDGRIAYYRFARRENGTTPPPPFGDYGNGTETYDLRHSGPISMKFHAIFYVPRTLWGGQDRPSTNQLTLPAGETNPCPAPPLPPGPCTVSGTATIPIRCFTETQCNPTYTPGGCQTCDNCCTSIQSCTDGGTLDLGEACETARKAQIAARDLAIKKRNLYVLLRRSGVTPTRAKACACPPPSPPPPPPPSVPSQDHIAYAPPSGCQTRLHGLAHPLAAPIGQNRFHRPEGSTSTSSIRPPFGDDDPGPVDDPPVIDPGDIGDDPRGEGCIPPPPPHPTIFFTAISRGQNYIPRRS